MSESGSSSNPNPNPYQPSSSYFPLPFHLQNADPAAQQYAYATPAVNVPAVPQQYAPSYSTSAYTLPQFQQAQQLFQRDAQTITPEALESVKAALASSEIEHKAETKKKAIPRKAAGQSWEDPTLAEWPENDFRLFCGDLGNEVNDDVLTKAFSRFPSFNMARLLGICPCCSSGGRDSSCLKTVIPGRGCEIYGCWSIFSVVRDKRTGKTRGYGFVSFANPLDLAAALKEMNGKYVGNRPIKLRKSNWKDRTDADALERQKNYTQKKPKITKKSILHK